MPIWNAALNRNTARLAAGAVSSLLAVIFSGCAIGTAPTPQDSILPALQGSIHGGNQPVVGAHIAVFATTSAGYNGTLTPIATTTSGANGAWNITSVTGTCPAGAQAYVVATGGNPGLAAGTDNSALFMVAAMGACGTSAVTSTSYYTINEVTTVAAAYTLGGFAPAGGAGMIESAIVTGTNVPGFTTSGTNIQGLADAFANATNIVNSTTGVAYTATPSNTAGIVPTATINALADILQDCVNSVSPSALACTNLFAAAAPPTGSGVAAPANVFQAALDIAQYPANNPAGLFALISSQSAFPSTGISAPPNDWSIGVTYTNPLLVSGTGLGINSADQVYVTGAGYVLNFSPQGVFNTTGNLTTGSPITTTDTLRQIVFGTGNQAYITDGAAPGVWAFTLPNQFALMDYSVAPVSEANNNTYGIAVDGQRDVWTASYSKATCASVTCTLVEYAFSTGLSPYSTFSSYTVGQPAGALGGSRGMAFDVKTGNIWITAIDDNLGELFNVTPSGGGAATATAAPTQLSGFGSEASSPATNTAYGTIAVAVDNTSRAWFVTTGGPAATKTPTAAVSAQLTPVSSLGVVGTGLTNSSLNTPTTVVVDGNNNLFIANGSGSAAASSVVEYSPRFNSNAGAFLSGTAGISPGSINTLGALSGGNLYEPSYLAVDRSGALWTLSSGSGATGKPANLIQIFGVAAPTNPVLAAGQYGVKP